MKYNCVFPKCDKILAKSLIEYHHVTPREIDNNSRNKNIIPLCPLHHKLIYVPESKAGQHSINMPESIQIIQMYKSTDGDVLHYKDYNGKCFYYFLRTKEIIEI